MNIADKIKDALKNNSSLDEYLDQLDSIDRESEIELKEEILKKLGDIDTKALMIGYFLPDTRYEKALLDYNEAELDSTQIIHWMLLLGKISSKNAFDRIRPYTETGFFHQAFIAMANINIENTMGLFDKFLTEHAGIYSTKEGTYKHDSGYNTLICLLEDHNEAAEFAKGFSAEGAKKNLIDDALQNYRL